LHEISKPVFAYMAHLYGGTPEHVRPRPDDQGVAPRYLPNVFDQSWRQTVSIVQTTERVRAPAAISLKSRDELREKSYRDIVLEHF
jgi:hypothetical protein